MAHAHPLIAWLQRPQILRQIQIVFPQSNFSTILVLETCKMCALAVIISVQKEAIAKRLHMLNVECQFRIIVQPIVAFAFFGRDSLVGLRLATNRFV